MVDSFRTLFGAVSSLSRVLGALAVVAFGLASPSAQAALAADLTLAMTASQTSVPALGVVTYTLTVRNVNRTSKVCAYDPDLRRPVCEVFDSAGAAGVRVVDTLPGPVLSVANTGTFGCVVSGNVVTCSGGTLAPDQSETITIQVRAPNDAATLTNTATVGFAVTTTERDTTNNSATAAVTVLASVGSPPSPLAASAISAGGNHTCVKRPNGNTYCWGWNNVGQVGATSTGVCQLDATTTTPPPVKKCVAVPTLVMQNTARIQTGYDHNCALNTSGTAYCWGNSSYGQAGAAISYAYTQYSVATPVQTGRVFSSISAGEFSTCAMSGGTAYCWGAIAGNLTGNATPLPTAIASFTPFQSVTVGYLHACVLTGSVGRPQCVGNNIYGQSAVAPFKASLSDVTQFPGTVVRLVSKVNTTCAELQNGTVMCVGENGWGQLGNGNYAFTSVPQLVGNGQQLHGVSVGTSHVCALDPVGQAWCWGNGKWGEFGDSTNLWDGASHVSPTPVRSGGARSYVAIAAGDQHTCAIGTDNQVYCWGRNYEGELGINYIDGVTNTPVTAQVPM